MAETLKKLQPAKGSVTKKFKKGRGIPSGSGKTCGRGHRGQKCRSGYSATPWKEGGQTPFYRRIPKHQTNTRVNRKIFTIINLDDIQDFIDLGIKEVSVETLFEYGRIKSLKDWGIKILGDGELKGAITVKADRFSTSAKAAIEKAGGKAEVVNTSQIVATDIPVE
jgi:large subunit ribosomal protein L15